MTFVTVMAGMLTSAVSLLEARNLRTAHARTEHPHAAHARTEQRDDRGSFASPWMTESKRRTKKSVWETGRGGRLRPRQALGRFARRRSVRGRPRLRGRVLRCALSLQRLGPENAIRTNLSIRKGLRFVFEGVGRSFRPGVVHGESLILFDQHELHMRSVTLDRPRLHVSRNPQPLRIRSRAHGMQFFDGDVITLTVLHPGIREIAEQHDNQHRDGPELQICVSLARHDDRSRGTLPHVRTVRAAQAGIKIREDRQGPTKRGPTKRTDKGPTKRLTSSRNAPTLLRIFAGPSHLGSALSPRGIYRNRWDTRNISSGGDGHGSHRTQFPRRPIPG